MRQTVPIPGPPGLPDGSTQPLGPPGPLPSGPTLQRPPPVAPMRPPGPMMPPVGPPVPCREGESPPAIPALFECPARPNHGIEGRPIMLRANHFQVRIPRGFIHHYDISILPDKCPRRVNRYCSLSLCLSRRFIALSYLWIFVDCFWSLVWLFQRRN